MLSAAGASACGFRSPRFPSGRRGRPAVGLGPRRAGGGNQPGTGWAWRQEARVLARPRGCLSGTGGLGFVAGHFSELHTLETSWGGFSAEQKGTSACPALPMVSSASRAAAETGRLRGHFSAALARPRSMQEHSEDSVSKPTLHREKSLLYYKDPSPSPRLSVCLDAERECSRFLVSRPHKQIG